jgi:hypothetical protein
MVGLRYVLASGDSKMVQGAVDHAGGHEHTVNQGREVKPQRHERRDQEMQRL